MKRRNFIKSASLIIPGIAMGARNLTGKTQQDSKRPLIIDGMGEIHPHYPMELIAEILDSGTNAITVTLGNPALHGPESFDDALESLSVFEHHIDSHRDYFLKATRVSDIDKARKERRLAIFYMFQNTTPIGDDLDRLDFFYRLGVRCFQLTYNTRNLVGEGCMEPANASLSIFGYKVIEKMNSMGMLVDLSHACPATMSDALKHSKDPVVISHSACLAVHKHHRNISDDYLKALGKNGGVIGIYQINPYISPKGYTTSLGDYIRHIDHAVNKAGVDHVGIGSDREHRIIPDTAEEKRKLELEMAALHPDKSRKINWPFFIKEFNTPRRMEVIWDGLIKHGHKSREVEKIMGKNFYRLYKDVIG
ncbi:MAG: membrane dipeptidase [Candidatus Aminicenantes bacterium]|nr:MAG: membrane dipeptidase [Candidatus Aminicenantes bacterium]